MKENDKYTFDNLLSEIKNTDLKDLGTGIGYIVSPFIVGIFSIIIAFFIMIPAMLLNVDNYAIYFVIPIMAVMNFFGFVHYLIRAEKYTKTKAIIVTSIVFAIVIVLIAWASSI